MKQLKTLFSKHKQRYTPEKRHVTLVAFTLLGVGILQLIFAAVYISAFHAPTARELPIAIVGDKATTEQISKSLEQGSKRAYVGIALSDKTEAEVLLKTQEVYAIYEPSVPQGTITVASANGKSLIEPLSRSLSQLDQNYQKQARKTLAEQPETAAISTQPIVDPQINDLAPLPASDSNGVSLFYVAFSAVFGGYLAAVAVNLVRSKRSFSRRLAVIRIAGFGVFSLLSSLCVGVIAVHGVDAISSDHYWSIVGIAALTTFGVSLVASSLVSLLGVIGTALIIVLFVILGTPASGGPVPLSLTGEGIWHNLAPFLPTGAAFGALRQVVYFENIDTMKHLWTLVIYVIAGASTLLAYGARRSSVSAFEGDIAIENR